MPVEGVDWKILGELSNGFSGADISALVKEAGMEAMREDCEKVVMKHFENAFQKVNPSNI